MAASSLVVGSTRYVDVYLRRDSINRRRLLYLTGRHQLQKLTDRIQMMHENRISPCTGQVSILNILAAIHCSLKILLGPSSISRGFVNSLIMLIMDFYSINQPLFTEIKYHLASVRVLLLIIRVEVTSQIVRFFKTKNQFNTERDLFHTFRVGTQWSSYPTHSSQTYYQHLILSVYFYCDIHPVVPWDYSGSCNYQDFWYNSVFQHLSVFHAILKRYCYISKSSNSKSQRGLSLSTKRENVDFIPLNTLIPWV